MIQELEKFKGKAIVGASFENEQLKVDFEDGSWFNIAESVPDCCACTYLHTDDSVSGLVGDFFVGAEILGYHHMDACGGSHEIEFLHIRTNRSVFVIESHNENNGYYCGVDVNITTGP